MRTEKDIRFMNLAAILFVVFLLSMVALAFLSACGHKEDGNEETVAVVIVDNPKPQIVTADGTLLSGYTFAVELTTNTVLLVRNSMGKAELAAITQSPAEVGIDVNALKQALENNNKQ